VAQLTPETLRHEAKTFSGVESKHLEPTLFGTTDGKAIGTYLEHKFRAYLLARGHDFEAGNAANGLDFPGLNIDIKVTSVRQPQSSCPFRSIRQKVFGLGYSLLVFVYEKTDDHTNRAALLKITSTIFVESNHTADYTMTRGLRRLLDDGANEDDLMGFMAERSLTTDEHELRTLAAEVMVTRPEQGYLTISPALPWRLQYKRVIEQACNVDGVLAVYRG